MTNKEPEEFTNLASVNLVPAKTRKLLKESQDSISRLFFKSNASTKDAFACVTSLTAMVFNETSETKDLETARQQLDLIKSTILDGLEKAGWQ